MKLLVGLGNPGEKYQKTRHNIGFMVINALGIRFTFEKRFNAEVGTWGKAMAVKPHTFMNHSGEAVAKIARYYKIKPKDMVIIHDDKDMVFPKIRVREKGSSGGHRGVQSVINALKTGKFTRLKIGTAYTSKSRMGDTAEFVLSNFLEKEMQKLDEIMPQLISFLEKFRNERR